MKKVNVILMTVALVLMSISTIVATEAPASIYVSKTREAKKIILNLDNMSADQVTCLFKNRFGEVIFRDKVSTASATAKQYDLSRLPIGRYTIEVEDLLKIERLDLTVERNGVMVKERIGDITFKPTVWLNEDRTVDFNLMTLGKDVRVSIYNPAGDLLKTDRFRNMNIASKRYNLKKVAEGTYRVVVSHKGKTFTYRLTV